MLFWLEFAVGMLILSPIFIVVYFGNREMGDHTRMYFKMLRDQQNAIKGHYDKIDKDS